MGDAVGAGVDAVGGAAADLGRARHLDTIQQTSYKLFHIKKSTKRGKDTFQLQNVPD